MHSNTYLMTTEQKTAEEILQGRGLVLTTFYSSSIYDAIINCMKDYASQKCKKQREICAENPFKQGIFFIERKSDNSWLTSDQWFRFSSESFTKDPQKAKRFDSMFDALSHINTNGMAGKMDEHEVTEHIFTDKSSILNARQPEI